MTPVALDSSVLVTWVLQLVTWQRAHALLSHTEVRPLLVGPVLTEVVHVARRRGNTSTPSQIWAALAAHDAAVEHPVTADLLRAAELRESSDTHPGPQGETLSLADALILATVERLEVPVVTRDALWSQFAADGFTTARVVDYTGTAKAPPALP